jgi:hypothetical protein
MTLLSFIFCISLLSAYLVLKIPGLLIKSQKIFLLISLLTMFFLILCDERVLSGISGTAYQQDISCTVLVVGFYICMLRVILLNSFFHLAVVSASALIASLAFFMAFSKVSNLNTLNDFFILLVFLALELMETHQTDYRTRQLFWRKQMEEEYLDNYELVSEDGNTTAASIFTDIELVIQSCDKIKANLKSAAAVIMYKDVKRKLKSAQSDLERVKRRLAQGTFSNITKLDQYSGLSEEEKKYIVQNFTNNNNEVLKKAKPISTKLLSASVMSERLVEVENLLNAVGTVWNLDIWFIFHSTNESVAIIGKYLFDKWQIVNTLMISSSISGNFFVALEQVEII